MLTHSKSDDSAENLPAAFARCFWLDIALLKPASSTDNPFSLAMSWVKSKGKPKVSYNLNASSPDIVFPERLDNTLSKWFNPRSRVSPNADSSALITFSIWDCFSTTSGKISPITLPTVPTKS